MPNIKNFTKLKEALISTNSNLSKRINDIYCSDIAGKDFILENLYALKNGLTQCIKNTSFFYLHNPFPTWLSIENGVMEAFNRASKGEVHLNWLDEVIIDKFTYLFDILKAGKQDMSLDNEVNFKAVGGN